MDNEEVPVLSILQASVLFLVILPNLAGDKKTPTRLNFKAITQRFGVDGQTLSKCLSPLFAKRILDRQEIRRAGSDYGYFLGDVSLVRISGWSAHYDVSKPVPDDLRLVLENALTSPPKKSPKHRAR